MEAQLLSAEQITLRLPLVTPEGAPFNDFQANGSQVTARLSLPAGQPGRSEAVNKLYSELGGSEYGCECEQKTTERSRTMKKRSLLRTIVASDGACRAPDNRTLAGEGSTARAPDTGQPG